MSMRIKSRTLQSLKIIVIEVAKVFGGLDNCNMLSWLIAGAQWPGVIAFFFFLEKLWYSFKMKPEGWLVFVYSVKGADFCYILSS